MLERLIETFCAVDDFCKAFLPHWEAYLIGNGNAPRRLPVIGHSCRQSLPHAARSV